MAARLRPRHQEEIKNKIQASKLVDFLQAVALTDDHPNVTALKIDSAKFLLNKSISNAPTEIEQTTELSGSIMQELVYTIVKPA